MERNGKDIRPHAAGAAVVHTSCDPTGGVSVAHGNLAHARRSREGVARRRDEGGHHHALHDPRHAERSTISHGAREPTPSSFARSPVTSPSGCASITRRSRSMINARSSPAWPPSSRSEVGTKVGTGCRKRNAPLP